MEFNDLIYLLFLGFFLITSGLGKLLKSRKAKQKTSSKPKGILAKFRAMVQELEAQAKKQRQEEERKAVRRARAQGRPSPGDDFWAQLEQGEAREGDSTEPRDSESWFDPAEFEEAWEPDWEGAEEPDQPPVTEPAMAAAPTQDVPSKSPAVPAPRRTPGPAPSGPGLRRAVIWAEILDRPVALRKTLPWD